MTRQITFVCFALLALLPIGSACTLFPPTQTDQPVEIDAPISGYDSNPTLGGDAVLGDADSEISDADASAASDLAALGDSELLGLSPTVKQTQIVDFAIQDTNLRSINSARSGDKTYIYVAIQNTSPDSLKNAADVRVEAKFFDLKKGTTFSAPMNDSIKIGGRTASSYWSFGRFVYVPAGKEANYQVRVVLTMRDRTPNSTTAAFPSYQLLPSKPLSFTVQPPCPGTQINSTDLKIDGKVSVVTGDTTNFTAKAMMLPCDASAYSQDVTYITNWVSSSNALSLGNGKFKFTNTGRSPITATVKGQFYYNKSSAIGTLAVKVLPK